MLLSCTTCVRAHRAPVITMLAARTSPASMAMSLAGMSYTETSSRPAKLSEMEPLTRMMPPLLTAGAKRWKLGLLRAMSTSGVVHRGDAISSSEMITAQFAVPPRISGPYAGRYETSFPSCKPLFAKNCPALSTPWPPCPANKIRTIRIPPQFSPADLSRKTPSGKVLVHSSPIKRRASTGRICQLVGQETSTSIKV